MGNTTAHAGAAPEQNARALEVCIWPPRVEPPVAAAKIEVVLAEGAPDDGEAGPILLIGRGCAAGWGEAVLVPLPSDTWSAVRVSFFNQTGAAVAQDARGLYAEVCLPPYRGPGGLAALGLAPGGAPRELRLALEPPPLRGGPPLGTPQEIAQQLRRARNLFHPEQLSVALALREVQVCTESAMPQSDGAARPALQVVVPPSRRQVIALELQHAALQGPSAGLPSHVRQLRMIQQESQELLTERGTILQRLDRLRAAQEAIEADGLAISDAASCLDAGAWSRAAKALAEEVAHGRARGRRCRAAFRDRASGLEAQLRQAGAGAGAGASLPAPLPAPQGQAEAQAQAPGGTADDDGFAEAIAMKVCIDEAMLRRDALLQHWRGVAAAAAAQPGYASEAVQRLLAQSQHQKQELAVLQREGAAQQERALRELGSQRQQSLRGDIQHFYDELDELERVRRDEHVRGESELRELRAERDRARDHLADAVGVLQHLDAQAEALRGMQVADEGVDEGAAIEVLQAEHDWLANELAQLREREEARKQTIFDLEQEQEALVEKTGLMTSQPVPSPSVPDLHSAT